jgi:hypothetical protein
MIKRFPVPQAFPTVPRAQVPLTVPRSPPPIRERERERPKGSTETVKRSPPKHNNHRRAASTRVAVCWPT